MSGSSRVDLASKYFHLSSETPCLNFASDPEDPGQESRFHREWKESASAWLEQLRPILERRFESLAAAPDPEWPILRFDEQAPIWNDSHAPEAPPPWKIGFSGMSGPGLTQIDVVFARLPSEEARERFRQELIKDVALLASPGGGL